MQLFADVFEAPRSQPPAAGAFGLERRFDATFVARLALREKQVQQSYRPVISIHKWFARRPGSVFRSLMLAEFLDAPLDEVYWHSNNIDGAIADPFMGGGTTIFESTRLGLATVGCDINPMAYWLVRQAVEPLDLGEFRAAAQVVWTAMQHKIGELYQTSCNSCQQDVPAKYFLWVKICPCPQCGEEVALYPGYKIADAVRHPREVYACPTCRTMCEIDCGAEAACPTCLRVLTHGNTKRGKTSCLSCGTGFAFAPQLTEPPAHRLFAIEYQCPACYPDHAGRQFKAPDAADHERAARAARLLTEHASHLRIPDDVVPSGDETNRLHRWGYHRYRDLFNDRQLVGLGLLLEEIAGLSDVRVRQALATVFSDFLRYQNLLCRYDPYALKCQDIFSVHGYPVGLIACENNLLGIPGVGSGSFIHFVEKYAKAKHYTQRPYETRPGGGRKSLVHMLGEQIEAPLSHSEPQPDSRAVWLNCAPSQDVALTPASLDGVFTDPPYYDNVQYAELMDFCFVWLRKLLGVEIGAFARGTTRSRKELTGNDTLGRDLENFAAGLSDVFRRMAEALKPGAPLVFTYHHNDPLAYAPLVVAILDAGLTCTTTLAVPAEMAASLHIAGTKSSILDSVFVCRHDTWVRARQAELPDVPAGIAARVARDAELMAAAGYRCTDGDLACLRAGHVAAEAVRILRCPTWANGAPIAERLGAVFTTLTAIEHAVGAER